MEEENTFQGKPKSNESENKYRRMVEMSPELVLLCSQEGEILYVNLEGLELLGFEKHEQIKGHKLTEIVHPTSAEDVSERLRLIFEESRDVSFTEELFLRADGEPINVEMMGCLFANDDQFAAHLVVRDITKRKKAEAAARRAKKKLVISSLVTMLVVIFTTGYYTYHYSESIGFCGTACHKVMEPEYALHKNSPHAHITCSQCHIGEGAQWYVKAKFSGLGQVYAVLANTFPKPIPAPIINLRPASETCENCHSSKVFHGNRIKVFRRVPDDGNINNPDITVMLLKIGGYHPENNTYTGIHWHTSNQDKVEYLAADSKRLQIDAVRVTRNDGKVEIYRANTSLAPANAEWRKMDCSDCHNRTAHNHQTPEDMVDKLILDGRLKSSLPDLKKASLDALGKKYPGREAAQSGILQTLLNFYKHFYPDLIAQQEKELKPVAKILYYQAYLYDVYPELNINWNTYPDHIGHHNDYGCFRCHDELHKTSNGKTISQDCQTCHTIMEDGTRLSEIAPGVRDLL